MPLGPLPPSYREEEPVKQFTEGADVTLPEQPDYTVDPSGAHLIPQDDGGLVIDYNPKQPEQAQSTGFDDNLAIFLDETTLSNIAEEVLQGIDNDIQSRRDWDNAYKKGIQLMGLKLEEASSEVGASGSISKVYHPLLIETTVRYQSNAMAELLPSSGPVKVRIDAPKTDQNQEDLADAFEKDFNHYLTVVAKEYYPDTDQLLFNQGWSGMAFKKVFECPIRKRPVSDLVLAPDLIVSNDVVDLETASRITHRTYLSNAMVRRMQKAKVYRKVDLGQPVEDATVVEDKVSEIAGVDNAIKLPADHRHTIYECYVELDIPGYAKDIPCPYIVTIDKDSRQVLAIYRNWEEGDEDYKTDCPFVKYGMIPALGFWDLGFVHLLGNTTRALTAILRMQLDAGMFSIFPGFLFAKQGGRQTNNDIRLPPGGGREIETGGMPIQQVAMPVPYPGPSPVLAGIAETTAEDGMRLGMSSEVQVGEGRADVPVGTVMALIEQSTKIMAAVHKRNHVAQQREFEKLRKLFNKNPQALWKFAKNPARKWQMSQEFSDFELVPASDPNVPSQTHRLMQSNAIVMLAQASPQTFNLRAVATKALSTIGVKDAESLLAPLPPPGSPPPPPPPEIQVKMMAEQNKAQQMQLQAQQQAMHDRANMQQMQMEQIDNQAERESREKIEALRTIASEKQHDSMKEIENLKFAHQMALDTHQHAVDTATDMFKHKSGIAADVAITHMDNQSKERMAQIKAEADKEKAKAQANKPKSKD